MSFMEAEIKIGNKFHPIKEYIVIPNTWHGNRDPLNMINGVFYASNKSVDTIYLFAAVVFLGAVYNHSMAFSSWGKIISFEDQNIL